MVETEGLTLANAINGELTKEESKIQLKFRMMQQETKIKELSEENAELRGRVTLNEEEVTQEEVSCESSKKFRFRPSHLMYIVALICLLVSICLFIKSFSSPEYALSGLLMLAPTFFAFYVGQGMYR